MTSFCKVLQNSFSNTSRPKTNRNNVIYNKKIKVLVFSYNLSHIVPIFKKADEKLFISM